MEFVIQEREKPLDDDDDDTAREQTSTNTSTIQATKAHTVKYRPEELTECFITEKSEPIESILQKFPQRKCLGF
jgi:hypothetical protein